MSTKKESPRSTKRFGSYALLAVVGGIAVGGAYFGAPALLGVSYLSEAASSSVVAVGAPAVPPLDTLEYDSRLLGLAGVATSSPWYVAYLQGTTTASTTEKRPLWPTRAAYPRDSRALLPFNRIVAYYGNFYSKQMGVLGEYDEATVLEKLRQEVAAWEAADPSTPVVPAIEYIDVTAQGSAGKDGKYRLRMPDTQVDKAIEMAKKINAIVILDIQVGLSTIQDELPHLDTYWAMPQVHLALDPEFAMHNGTPPGRVIGSMSAADINYAIDYLSAIVREHNLPPKILVVHRFTEDMVTGYRAIRPTPEVQVVVQMDGWGSPQRKKNTYNTVVYPEPVQFTGLKLFYKNDLKEDPPRLLTPREILDLTPSPSFIQYQ